jgi:rod shape-determining protein MreD
VNVDTRLPPLGPELVAPPGPYAVYGSLALAVLCTLLPWPAQVLWLVPDFTLMVLLYWNIQAPLRAGLGVAFLLGLLTDASHGVLFGLHALTYVGSAFVTLYLRRRLENFRPLGQALQIAPILLGQQVLVLALGLPYGRMPADWWRLASGLVAALLWLPLCLMLNHMTGRQAAAQAGSGPEGK